MTDRPVEPVPPEAMLGESDWDDEDLLTITEATTRLADEIAAARSRVAAAERGGPEALLIAERTRLEQLIQANARIKAAQANAPR